MITVIPAAGRSSRYFGNKPKWLRTLPDGKLMIESAIEGLVEMSNRTLLVTTREIENEYNVTTLIEQIFIGNVEVIVLDKYTNSAIQTVVEGLSIAKVDLNEYLVIKDSDNVVSFDAKLANESFSVGVDISKSNVSNLGSKSFFRINENGEIVDFVEKKIISQYISVGTHGFTSVITFLDYATMLLNEASAKVGELYISNVVALMIYNEVRVNYIEASYYLDLGTQLEWEALRKSKSTFFVDFDGTLVRNAGKYGKHRWGDGDIGLESNLNLLKKLFNSGAQIIITTSRSDIYEDSIFEFLKERGIIPYRILTGLNHSARYLINDFAETNIYPSAIAINIPRNGSLTEYLADI